MKDNAKLWHRLVMRLEEEHLFISPTGISGESEALSESDAVWSAILMWSRCFDGISRVVTSGIWLLGSSSRRSTVKLSRHLVCLGRFTTDEPAFEIQPESQLSSQLQMNGLSAEDER